MTIPDFGVVRMKAKAALEASRTSQPFDPTLGEPIVTLADFAALARMWHNSEITVSAICSVIVDVMGPGWVVTPENVVDTIEGLLQADFVRYTKAEAQQPLDNK